MFRKDLITKLAKAREEYERQIGEILAGIPDAESEHITFSGLPVKPLFTPADIADTDFIQDILED